MACSLLEPQARKSLDRCYICHRLILPGFSPSSQAQENMQRTKRRCVYNVSSSPLGSELYLNTAPVQWLNIVQRQYHILACQQTNVTAKWGTRTLSLACNQAYPGSTMCVQNFDDSRGPAIRITYRISLRSSSLWEP